MSASPFAESLAVIRREIASLRAKLADLQTAEEVLARLVGEQPRPPQTQQPSAEDRPGKPEADPPLGERGRRISTTGVVRDIAGRLAGPGTSLGETELGRLLDTSKSVVGYHLRSKPHWFSREGEATAAKYTLTDQGRRELLPRPDPTADPSGTTPTSDGT